jgi:hypothetical protein
MHSLYALPVAHYISVFGRENVKVVSAEALDVRDQVRLYDTLNEVFTFIGKTKFQENGVCICVLALHSN